MSALTKQVLERVCAAIYKDAIVCKVRHDGMVRNKAVYLAVGIDPDGGKDVLGLWIDTAEGAKFWLKIYQAPVDGSELSTSSKSSSRHDSALDKRLPRTYARTLAGPFRVRES